MKRIPRLPPDLHGRAFRTHTGTSAGLSTKRMRAGDLIKPFAGIRTPVHDQTTPDTLITAYGERMSARDFFSHVSAARLHALPLPAWLARDRTVHLSTERQELRERGRGVAAHHVTAGSIRIVEVRGLRATSPVDTWCQLSTVLGVDDLIVMGDALVRRKNPLATMDELRRAVARYAGHRGARKLREALGWVRPGVDSPKETVLRLLLVRAHLPEPEVNGEIFDSSGTKIATGDLIYREYRVVVEYDGEQHRTDEEQYHWDVDRIDSIVEAGWRHIRINKSHLRNRPATVIRKVTTALRFRGWRP